MRVKDVQLYAFVKEISWLKNKITFCLMSFIFRFDQKKRSHEMRGQKLSHICTMGGVLTVLLVY